MYQNLIFHQSVPFNENSLIRLLWCKGDGDYEGMEGDLEDDGDPSRFPGLIPIECLSGAVKKNGSYQ